MNLGDNPLAPRAGGAPLPPSRGNILLAQKTNSSLPERNNREDSLDSLADLNLPRGLPRNENSREDAPPPLPPRGQQPPPPAVEPGLNLNEEALCQMMREATEWATQLAVTLMIRAPRRQKDHHNSEDNSRYRRRRNSPFYDEELPRTKEGGCRDSEYHRDQHTIALKSQYRLSANQSPFISKIMCESIPKWAKFYNMPEFDGTRDPHEHIAKFRAKAELYQVSDAIYRKIFRTTFSKKALTWFDQLPVGSIDSLETLKKKILEPILH